MTGAKISIVIPVYNAEKRLALCLDSLLQQTYQNYELILVNDGSQDNSMAICDEYARRDCRVQAIHKENGGVSSARNEGLTRCTGDFIAFVDSDDTIDDNFLEEAYKAITESETDFCISGLVMETWADGQLVDVKKYSGVNRVYSVRELLEAKEIDYPTICISGPCCKIYKASVIHKHHIRFDESLSLGEDTCFVLDYLSHVSSVVFMQDCYYHYYRGAADSLYSRYIDNYFETYSKVIAKSLETMSGLGCGGKTLLQEKNRSIQYLMDCIMKEYVFFDRSSAQKKRQVIREVAGHPLIAECKVADYSTGLGSRVIFCTVKYKMVVIADLLLRLRRVRLSVT